jgi:hypothetical protein
MGGERQEEQRRRRGEHVSLQRVFFSCVDLAVVEGDARRLEMGESTSGTLILARIVCVLQVLDARFDAGRRKRGTALLGV